MTKGYEIISLFETFAPPTLAMEGDKIGLMVGSLERPVRKVLVTLDVTEKVVEEAIAKDVQLIIAHHPLIFRPLKSIPTEKPYGRIIEKLLKYGIAVYAAHTNLDITRGGVNDMLAEALHLQETEVLVPTHEVRLRKLVVYVPVKDAEKIRRVLGEMGAGAIGDYSHCSFSAVGTGRFLPGKGTNPHIGTVGKLEAVEEERIETVYPETIEKPLIQAMLQAHPYEEPAYDIYPLELPGEVYGLGRIGVLEKEMSMGDFVEYVKERLSVPGVRVVGSMEQVVRKVAILGGDGDKYWRTAQKKGADVYVTGDIYYHTAVDAAMEGFNIVDPGHHIEKIMKEKVAEKLTALCTEKNLPVEVMPSEVVTEPFRFY